MTNDFVQRLTVVLHSHWRHFRKVDMIMALTQERKNEIIKEYARHEGDTGSAEVQ
ncbi:30S ribosomal protein S15, partial [human gut metagenome]